MATSSPARIEIDLTYGGVYAGSSFEISAPMADHFNRLASAAGGVLDGEYRAFIPGPVFSIACPTVPLPRAQFIEAYQQLRAVIDDEHEIVLSDHPRLFSGDMGGKGYRRGVPSYIPKSLMPEGFFGRTHQVEVFQGQERLFGPRERFFHSETSGAIYNQIEDAPGKLVLEVRGDLGVLAQRGEICFFTDPAFGEPTGVTQLEEDGQAAPLDWHMLGVDQVGDTSLFNEWVAVGVAPKGRTVAIEVSLPNRATGLAAALYFGHTRDAAFRPDATVL